MQLVASRILCILAHPDDEIYCCCYLREILLQGGEVFAAYIMNEDIGRARPIRKKEALASMREIGVNSKNVFFIGMDKREVFDQLYRIVQTLRDITRAAQPDCILAQDFEGGHEAHDIASFCASEVVRMNPSPA